MPYHLWLLHLRRLLENYDAAARYPATEETSEQYLLAGLPTSSPGYASASSLCNASQHWACHHGRSLRSFASLD